MQTLTLLKELLSKKSITPDDAGCLTLITKLLEENQFQCDTIQIENVTNFWATHGSGSPVTVFAGHTDVVPPGDESKWLSPPFEPTERDGYLYARGAADMKSGVAAMSIAANEYVKANPDHKGTIAIMLTSDEEGDAKHGIKALMPYLDSKGVKIDYAIFTEPSCHKKLGDTLKNGRRGSMHGYLKLIGKQGHIAYPSSALNPAHIAPDVIKALTSETWCQGNQYFSPTSLQIWNMKTSTSISNVIPETVSIDFNLRFTSELTASQIQERLHNILKNTLKKHNGFDYKLNFHVSGEPFLTDNQILIKALQESCKEVLNIVPEPSTTGGTSDARFVAPYAKETIEFGPVNATIHQVNECVKIADLEPLTNVFITLLKKLND